MISLDLKVAEIQNRREDLIKLIVENVKNVVGFGRAEALVLECMSTGFAMVDEVLTNKLRVPVINPVKIALKLAEVLAYLNLTHSRSSYPAPDLTKLGHLIPANRVLKT